MQNGGRNQILGELDLKNRFYISEDGILVLCAIDIDGI